VDRWRQQGAWRLTTPLDGEQGSNLAAMSDQSPHTDEMPQDDSAEIEALRAELAASDPTVVIANHCYGLFELAAVYLSEQPPRLEEAQLAIDALAGVVEALGERLGAGASQLLEGLAQLRLAWVQLQAVAVQQEGDQEA